MNVGGRAAHGMGSGGIGVGPETRLIFHGLYPDLVPIEIMNFVPDSDPKEGFRTQT